ncbi:MAG: ABC transporter [Roseibacillus sp.]|jgi:ABC-2 type transport system ATP-binding protein|nr:ABC transporter [Roseibacillus sp.]MCP4731091.1 ATP-binding cassette domain-containing protein [Roseibacillus sp.]MDP7308381.1 ATP-binding cassette domain-containing protein [Roseibacillus sp.]HJM63423.1 ATP-binding cassette domain-containing protein [Roseibacillus sp.]|tara:strand:+ start:8789 stop:9721 length:933 start_codon:yes stop_codon:yes gene_type:complete
MIKVNNLTKRFGRHLAVAGATFEVEQGQVVGFLGPNGAGKTTTIRMLTGFLPPTSGSAAIDSLDVSRHSVEARRQIGYLPESVPLYRDMRVREYLRFRGQIKGLKGKALHARMDEVLERCGLREVRRKMIKTLSKGFRQRVGLADALIHDPPLLILDEPTNGLDPNQIRSIRHLIKQLGKSHTILLSTHILTEVEMICDKIVIIDDGKILASDTPSNLVSTMRAAGRISIEIRTDPEKARERMTALDHVKKVNYERSRDDWAEFSVLVESGTDTRERLARLAQDEGWPLRNLHRHDATLEDVFVELTRKD